MAFYWSSGSEKPLKGLLEGLLQDFWAWNNSHNPSGAKKNAFCDCKSFSATRIHSTIPGIQHPLQVCWEYKISYRFPWARGPLTNFLKIVDRSVSVRRPFAGLLDPLTGILGREDLLKVIWSERHFTAPLRLADHFEVSGAKRHFTALLDKED